MGDDANAGQGDTHTALADRLRKLMTARRMSQADLATAAGLSKAAVSNILNEKSVPHVDTLDRLAEALGITGKALSELHRLRDRADPRGRRLDSYLHAALGAARDHPYPGVLPGTTPPLAAVYVRQQATRRTEGEPEAADREGVPHRDAGGVLPAEQLLADGQMCLILAGPGGGKSSLLRTHLTRAIEQWLASHGGNALPVLIPAAELDRAPLIQALASAVNAELRSHGLVDELPPAFFATPPRPGVRWLVLVDGLDEITDPAARRRVLRTVATVAGGEQAALYRFAIATRPLPDAELTHLGPGVPRYDLLPFAPEDLPAVAGGWFRQSGLPDPDEAATRFTQALDRTHMTGLARIPLMLSMLCQLHAAAPEQLLPPTRGRIYDAFITELHKRQHAPGPGGIRVQTCAGLDRYGPSALAQAEHTLDHLHQLIAHLAAERHRGSTLPALTIVESQPEAQRPTRLPPDEWRAFLSTCLSRSGLLTTRAGEHVFLHQTLLEHLAARHATRTPQSRAHALHQAFHLPARLLESRPWDSRHRPGDCRRYWKAPADLSYTGFLLNAAHEGDPAAATPYLARLASFNGGLEGCAFITAQVQLGTPLPQDVIHAAADVCHDLAREATLGDFYRLEAVRVLAELGDVRAADLWHDLAREATLDRLYRLKAAWALAELGDVRAADLWHDLARDTTFNGRRRLEAARALTKLNGVRAADLWHDLARDTTLNGHWRQEAAWALAKLWDERAADVWQDLARDTTLDSRRRQEAAWARVKFQARARRRSAAGPGNSGNGE
ncbi:NACHT domain-containing protein [Streptomyces triticiradicis]|uniref:Helix-turn-helix domain-containing protein n=1 Tax=Streptomyces triticiradicis TaxID=2651189 RepID=A0A7J5D3G1_9ACTN|nr:helix-turn-helix domain-containing protein [Streptomyces triticiradicis]KAB1978528.1 helix-turn-helix domain-containing protein [Streptomyces triticiradicis]